VRGILIALVWLPLSSSPCVLVHFAMFLTFSFPFLLCQATAFMPIAPVEQICAPTSKLLLTPNQRPTSLHPIQCSHISESHTDRVTRAALNNEGSHISDPHTDRVTRAAFIAAFLGVSVLISPQALAADDNKASDPSWAAHDGPFADSEFAGYAMSPSGLKYKDVVAGSGAQPEADPLKSPTEHLFPNIL
jgi:hypothetical protein